MALTATFAADFQAFERSIAAAQVHLQVFDRATKSASRSVSRELESISGQRVAAEAAKMAEAVKRLGGEGGTAAGLLKLTDDELRRVTTTMAAATEKAERLGEDLPEAFRHINNEIAKLPKPLDETRQKTGLLDATFAKLTASFAAASIVDRVIGFVFGLGVAAVSTASKLTDLNAATGVGVEALQRWGSVAKLGGIQLEDMTTASFKLGAAIDGGGRSVREAVGRLGLSFEHLRSLQPEQQMDEILRAAEALGPSQERNAILVDLFGSRAAQALAQVVDGYRAVADATATTGEAQVRALDEAAKAWDRLVVRAESAVSTILGNLALLTEGRGTGLGSGVLDLTAEEATDLALLKKSGGDIEAYVESLKKLRAERAAASDVPPLPVAATRDYVAELAKLQQALNDLTPAQREQLDAAIRLGASTEDIARQFGVGEEAQRLYATATKNTTKALETADDFQARFNDSVSRSIEETKKATAELKSFIDATNSRRMAQGDTMPDMTALLERQYTGPIAAALQSNAKAHATHQRELDALVLERTKGRLKAQIAEIQRWAADEKAALDRNAGAWQANADLIDEIARERTAAINQMDDVSIAALGLGPPGSVTKPVNRFAQELKGAMRTALGDVSSIVIDTIVQGGDWRRGAVAIASRLGAAVGGAVGKYFGGPAGEAIGQAIGSLAGPALNKLIGVFTGPSAQADIQRRVKESWGVAISEGLAAAIAQVAAQQFRGNRQAAEIFSLDKIIAEGGGLNASNLDRMASKLRDVFVLLQTGAFSAAQAADVLGRNWQAFVDAGTDAAGRLAPALVEIIRLTRELGVVSKEVQGYLLGQSSTALDGLNAIVNASKGQFDTWRAVGERVREAQARIEELNNVAQRGRGVDWAREMAKAQADLNNALADQKGAAASGAAELENLARIAMGTYAAAIEAGMSHNAAMRAAAPAMAQLIQAYEDLGINVEDAGLKAFLAQAKFVAANPEIIAGIDGLAQSMIALSNMGLLNAETFGHMQEAGLRMYERLLAEAEKMGLSGDEASRAALLPMQEYLREAARQAELLGIPLDEATQKLIDQSKELGIWRDKGKDPLEEMRDAMREVRDVVKELVDELKRIPANVTSNVKVRYTREGEPGPGGRSGSDGGPGPAATAGPSRASVAAASRAATSGVIKVPLYIDGRQVAYASAPYRRDAERAWGAD